MRLAMLGAAVVLVAAGAVLLLQVEPGKVPSARAACGPEGGLDCLPAFEATSLDGQALSPATLKGKVVLVNFWATWCHPCVEEMPALETVYQDHKDQGFVIVGMLVDHAGDDTVRAFLQKMGISYPIVRAGGPLEAKFGYPQVLPTSVLYDRSGHQERKWNGGISRSTLETAVRSLTGR